MTVVIEIEDGYKPILASIQQPLLEVSHGRNHKVIRDAGDFKATKEKAIAILEGIAGREDNEYKPAGFGTVKDAVAAVEALKAAASMQKVDSKLVWMLRQGISARRSSLNMAEQYEVPRFNNGLRGAIADLEKNIRQITGQSLAEPVVGKGGR